MSDSQLNWDKYFFSLIDPIKQKSKDPNTKVGCIIVGPDHEIRTTGYNSFPRGLRDDVPERLVRPEKYLWIEHSERNAIYNAAATGTPLKGCTIYMQGIPCMECARGIVQARISEIRYDYNESLKWNSPLYNKDMMNKSEIMLAECGVVVTPIVLEESK